MSNANLNRARKLKNDEFYTRYEDIEAELSHYTEFLTGKKILCNCNDSLESNFYKWFDDNFERLELKSLTCTSYGDHAYKVVRIGNETRVTPLKGDGDFASEECKALLRETDIVVSNPPFSKALQYLALLEEYGKKYIFIGNVSMAACKEVFPLVKAGKLGFGYEKVADFHE